MKVDYLIVGQGIAGTLLSYELLRAGKTVLVLDNNDTHRSSLVAGAVINPLAGKHRTVSADAARFIPKAITTYRDLELLLGAGLLQETALLIFYENKEGRAGFEKNHAYPEGTFFTPGKTAIDPFFNNEPGAEQVNGLWLVDAARLFSHWQKYLEQGGHYRTEQFEQALLRIGNQGVIYKDVEAGAILFCEGAAAAQNPLFNTLPFTHNRGEALLVRIPGLPQQHIYHRKVRLVPKGNGLFWCGTNYKWNFEDLLPDEQWKQETIAELRSWLKIPFTVEDHIVAQRPTTAGQIPLIGVHPEHSAVAIFNGLGTRGFSAGPFWAAAFAAVLAGKEDTIPKYNESRFRRFFTGT